MKSFFCYSFGGAHFYIVMNVWISCRYIEVIYSSIYDMSAKFMAVDVYYYNIVYYFLFDLFYFSVSMWQTYERYTF